MCGIVGSLARVRGAPWNATGPLASIRHRGPDDQGFWEGDGVYLANCRLSIIDVKGGHQPIFNEDRTACIVYNGELYNFLDLRPELESLGHVFQTHTDTEVVLHAFEEWGDECLKRFNGMFAFAIWNSRTETLFIARDRLGEKPLYYWNNYDRFIFASEIKAILSDPDVPRRMSNEGLRNFLTFGHSLAPQTMYDGICKLLPGHYMLVRRNNVRTIQYWDVGEEPQIVNEECLTRDQYVEGIRALLDDSVRRRMIADVPVGAFLSGGVDSSAIVALMKKHATGPVKTFSLGFAAGGAYNELSAARSVAKNLGTDHHELCIEHIDLVEVLNTLVYYYDEPFGDPAAFPTYLLSRFARQQVKVVLTGEGGDELFGGYRRYAMDNMASTYQRLPRLLIERGVPRLVESLPRLRRLKRIARTLPIHEPSKRYAGWLEFLTHDLQQDLLQGESLSSTAEYDPAWQYPYFYYRGHGGAVSDHLNRLMYVDLKTWLADDYLEKVDKATMACSLEGRIPILDHRLVELAFQIPSPHKIRGLSTKRIFKQAAQGLVPKEVLRRSKQGFAVPLDPWFRGHLKDFTFDILLDQRTRNRGYFNVPTVERLWREHVEGRRVWDSQLWLLLNLELWQRAFMDGQAP